MGYTILFLCVILAIMIFWVIILKMHMRSISKQLEKRIDEGARNSISIAMFDKDAIRLAENINNCLVAEENAKQALASEERQFRRMIADISHDLRTPLTSIKGYLQLLSSSQLNDTQRGRLAIIEKHVMELGGLIEHFFEYSYLLSVENQLNLERFSLTAETEECLAAAVPQFEAHCMSVEIGELPSAFIIADREKTVRIIQNLIRNCLQHSAGNLSVSITDDGEFAELSMKNPVSNTQEIQPDKLFDRFYTAEKSRGKSTGLGLSIVKLLAEQMNGSTSARLEGNNLMISVRLPKAQ
ncbi:MAG: sensor histidine kinase [Acutalibacteraceae bacterium]